jgi:rRNA maturation protein Nop10
LPNVPFFVSAYFLSSGVRISSMLGEEPSGFRMNANLSTDGRLVSRYTPARYESANQWNRKYRQEKKKQYLTKNKAKKIIKNKNNNKK